MEKFYGLPFVITGFNGVTYIPLGSSGLCVSPVGLGTWTFGYPEKGDGSRVREEEALPLLDRAVELGVTFWDTANRYNNSSGNSERIIGKWVKRNSDQRRNVIIATKMFGGMDGFTPNHSGLSRTNILESVYASLERLQTDHIDLLYFHSFDPKRPVDESLFAIDDLVRQDLVRYFGVSNFTVENLESYQSIIDKFSLRFKISAVQNQFDILDGERKPYENVLSHATKKGISFVAWSPLARGLLSGKYLHQERIGAGDRLFDEGLLKKFLTPEKEQNLVALSKIAGECEISISQLALAYMLQIPGMGPVIPTSSNIRQLEENASVAKINLTQTQIEKIHKILN